MILIILKLLSVFINYLFDYFGTKSPIESRLLFKTIRKLLQFVRIYRHYIIISYTSYTYGIHRILTYTYLLYSPRNLSLYNNI